MRPRPEGRGEPIDKTSSTPYADGFNAATTRRPWRTTPDRVQSVYRQVASMRPRPEGRGERLQRTTMRPLQCCFNAATTRRPWRTRPAVAAPRPRRGCFNAATTRRPWRTMYQRSLTADALQLQCGHDPKAVENHSIPSGQQPTNASLQCGHDPKAVENARGNAPRHAQLVDSMRPRPEGRGEPPTSACCGPPRASFNAATTRRPWRTRQDAAGQRRLRPLQCGHDPKAVENLAQPLNRFVSATPLQCGHDPKAVENLARCGS